MSIYQDARQIVLDIRGQWDRSKRFVDHFWDGSFARDRLLGAMLWAYEPEKLRATQFINYSAWKDHYGDAPERVELKAGGSVRTVRMPYQLIVDFVSDPNISISVEQPIAEYAMPESLASLTQPNLEAYLSTKKRSFDGRVVRLERFDRKGKTGYGSAVSKARYWQQARTNLTIDLPVRSDGDRRSLRERDLSPTGDLRALGDSLLLNSIGVCTTVGFRSADQWHFFAKLRNADDAVAEKMLGSASGVAELLPGQHIRDLLCYAESEIVRELYNETGLSCNEVVRIVPLAFCRELVRGGKPQFMFFVEIDHLPPDRFKELFRKSTEGLDEFYDNWLSAATAHGRTLSYELAYNLVLTMQFLQQERHQPRQPVVLKL